ncbi:3-hydroxyacyl-CoA dehydrogenase family protein [Marimonas sp. MJW-29]|uniref:3-hydroxyacyl-CoA dehydrogenase family protein n=1 Tax=Sulfitobacter sediminis TaxID=3234186 RepID=A0ABV3RHB9_9RHOB
MTEAEAVTALQDAFWLAGEELMFRHTNPWELDEALVAAGFTMGPCEAQDLLGLEKVLARQSGRPIPILPRMVAEGRLGKIGGVGFYRYPGGGGAVIDPLIEDLILEEAWFARISRSEISDNELVLRMHAALKPICKKLLGSGWDKDALIGLLQKAVHFPPDASLRRLGLI